MNNTPNQSNRPVTPEVGRPARAVRTPQGTQSTAPQVRRPQATAARTPQSVQSTAPQVQRPQATTARVPQSAQSTAPQVQRPQATAARTPQSAPQTAPTTEIDLSPQRGITDDQSATRRIAVTPARKRAAEPDSLSGGGVGGKKKKKHMSEGAATLLSIVKAITYIVFVIVLAGFLSYYIIRIANDMFAFVKSDEMVEVVIPEYATIDDVTEVLAENGIITYPDVFKLYAKLNQDNGEFKAGTYEINGMMNYDELLMAFKEKFVRATIRITIPEGYTVDEIIDLFIENGVGMVERSKGEYVAATREDYVAAVNNLELYDNFVFVQKLIEGGTSPDRYYALEGYLFPDTYEFYTDSKPSQIVYKLLNRFNNLFKEEFYTRADELGYTVDEIVILASMIEKETRLYYEFEAVSSVFHNRLRDPANYAFLESDATIMYAIHHDTGTRQEDMTHEDVSYDSPYNTYTNRGLPPGPIANPSYQALTCALYPEDTDYYFFVSRKNGETIFSRTLAEHDAAVAEVAREG